MLCIVQASVLHIRRYFRSCWLIQITTNWSTNGPMWITKLGSYELDKDNQHIYLAGVYLTT